MKLHVLGSNSQEKGKQLETLTCKLLEKRSYKNLTVNERGAGGHEIDIRGDIVLPAFEQEQVYRIICECKAHKHPVNMNDWLKFLGKIYVEEAKLNKQIYGCFITLSGANGPVTGNYDSLRDQGRTNIELVTGDGLVRLLSETYSLPRTDAVIQRIATLTTRQIISISLCYYNQKIYWLVEFEDEAFTLLMSDGSDVEQSSSIIGMVSESTVSGAFFSLSIEYEAELKRKNDEKEVLASLMLMGGAGSLQQIISKSAELSNDLEASNRITPGDIQQALNRLSDKGLVQSEQSEYRLLKDTSAKSIATLYRYFLGGRYPVRALGSEFYDKNINGELLEYICEIQVGLVLSPEDKDMCLKLLLWSPNALFTSLHPIPMIVSHRQMQPEIQSARIDKHDIDIFMRLLYDCFKRDYNSRELCEYFAVKRDLREVDTWYNINIKSSKALVSKLEQRTRLAIVRLAESLGGGYSHISVLEDMPEPWDLGKGSNDSE